MIQEIMHDPIFLAKKSRNATIDDISVGMDLLETLESKKDVCVGMAANMIGQNIRIIAFDNNGEYLVMYNPEIIKSEGCYVTEEGCLSLKGGPRKTKRFKKIKVKYYDCNFKIKIKSFENWPAQIIQHEIDHCEGILI